MDKRLFTLFAVLLLTAVNLFSDTFDLKMVKSTYEVNRKDTIIWIDVQVSNDQAIKNILFDVKLNFVGNDDCVVFPIPAYNVYPDGTKDLSKWTHADDKGNGVFQFHYWMADRAADYLPANLQFRTIMRFYIKSKDLLPDCGKLNVTFDNFQVTGVNSAGYAVNMSAPASREYLVNLGDCPPEETILNLSADAQVTRTANVNDITVSLNYLSKKPFTELAFDLTTIPGASKPSTSFTRDGGNITVTNITTEKWRVTITGTFPTSNTLSKWLNFYWPISSQAHGTAQYIMNNFSAKDVNGKKLPVTKEIILNVDLGDPIDGIRTVRYSLSKHANDWFSLQNYETNKFGDMLLSLNIDNLDKSVKTTSFTIEIPNYFNLLKVLTTIDATGKEAEIKQIGSTASTKTYQVDMVAAINVLWTPNNPNNNPRELAVLVLNFIDLPAGPASFVVDNISALQSDGQEVNATKHFSFAIDFLPEFWRFKKGDSNYNFGDGVVDWTDLYLLGDYLNGIFKTPSLYQLWAFDFNADGVIDWKDYDDLNKYLGGSAVNDENSLTTTVYPNPSSGPVTFEFTSTDFTANSLVIYNIMGAVVYQGILIPGKNSINLNLPTGAYYWQVNASHGSLLIEK